MARPNITALSVPPKPYRPDIHSDDFETLNASKVEDATRARLLRQLKLGGSYVARAAELAARLEQSANGLPPDSPASKLYMRNHRIRVFGNLWRLVEETKRPVSTFTVVRQVWHRGFDNLDTLDPIKLKATFRQGLYREGATEADGWLFAALDGEFDPPTQGYQLHLHGVVCGGMIDVLDRLRPRTAYLPWQANGPVPGCGRPIQVSRAPLTNLPSSIAYHMKGFWKVEAGRTSRIPEPFGSHALLYLDQYGLNDLTLLVKLGVVGGKLIPAG